jgi:S-adenosylhomocysteine hydrolase
VTVKSEVTQQIEAIQEGDLVITTSKTVVLVTGISREYYSGVVVASACKYDVEVGEYSMAWEMCDCTRFHGSVLLTS